MTPEDEWYVLSMGTYTPRPIRPIKGRRAAVDALRGGFILTPAERTSLAAFLEGPEPIVGIQLQLVGYNFGTVENPDRWITRVESPEKQP